MSNVEGGELQVTRWCKYGHQRLYVSAPDGIKVGWYDILTGEEHLDHAELIEGFRAILTLHLGEARPEVEPTPEAGVEDVPTPTPGVEVADSPARLVADLAGRRPGQAAREKAELEAAAARERGRVRFAVDRFRDSPTDERNWRVGADGEEKVGSRLDKLRKQGWFILHAIPIGEHGSDIDHVVIGPGGVFCINTKTHLGKKVWVGGNTVMVSGQRQPYVRNSRFEARRTAELLTLAAGAPVGVRPILAIMCAELAVKTQPEDVIVVGSRTVAPWLAKRKRVYSPEEVALLYGWARLSTTWEKQAATVPKSVPEPRAPTPVAGQWAPDPYGRAELRFFDGTSWTAHVASGGQQATEAPAGP